MWAEDGGIAVMQRAAAPYMLLAPPHMQVRAKVQLNASFNCAWELLQTCLAAWPLSCACYKADLHVFWAVRPANRLAPASTGGRDSKCTLLVEVYQPAPCIVSLLDKRWNQAHKQPSLLRKSNTEVQVCSPSQGR